MKTIATMILLSYWLFFYTDKGVERKIKAYEKRLRCRAYTAAFE